MEHHHAADRSQNSDAKQVKSPQQCITARHTHYVDRCFLETERKFRPLCGKIQQDRISKHYSYDARVLMKVWQHAIILYILTRVQDGVDYSTLAHIHLNSRNEKWERTYTNMRNKGDY